MHKVFVYGTLLKGERNDHFLKNARCIADICWTHGELYDTGYGYPAVNLSNETRVYGELYQISDSELLELDQLEEYTEGARDNLYERVEREIITESGIVLGYVYIAASDNLLKTLIPSGDWKSIRN